MICAQPGLKSRDNVYESNLFDEEYLTYINNIGFFKLDIFGERQTFGVSVRYRFQ